MGFFVNFLGDNAYEVDAKAQEAKLRQTEPLLLGKNETIELAMKNGRDGRDKSYFTSHRILLKNGKGLVGTHKRKNFASVPFTTIQGFTITTAGAFLDFDVQVVIQGGSAGTITLDLAKSQVNLFALQQFLSAKVLQHYTAQGTQDHVKVTQAGTLSHFTSFLTGDATSYDPVQIKQRFTTETPVLMPHERVDLAFKTGRDFLIFTSDRIVSIDVQGLLGKKISFQTILWSTIRAARISTPGGVFDRDMEMTLHTNLPDNPSISIDFRRGSTNIFDVMKCIGNQILGPDEAPTDHAEKSKQKSGWSWGLLFDPTANRPVDTTRMNQVLHSNPPILQGSEQVELAFQGIRDMVVFTTKRILIIDPQSIRGKRVEYTSIPWKSVLTFAIETAGHFVDFDTEVMIWTDMIPVFEDEDPKPGDDVATLPQKVKKPALAYMALDFNKKLVDVIALKKYLSFRCLKATSKTQGVPPPTAEIATVKESVLGNFFSYFSDNQRAVDPKGINTQLHKDTPLLLDDETVVMAFKAGRDLTIFTNMRVMILDVQVRGGFLVSTVLVVLHLKAMGVPVV
jgi:hypothetical protein